MAEKKYDIVEKAHLLPIWSIFKRWPCILLEELNRIIANKDLRLFYENTPVNQIHTDKESSKVNTIVEGPIDNAHFSWDFGFELFIEKDRVARESDKFQPPYFIFLPDVIKLEKEHPEYIDIDKAEPTLTTERIYSNDNVQNNVKDKEESEHSHIERSVDATNDDFWKRYPLIALVKDLHNDGLSRKAIIWELTENKSLTNNQAGVLCAKDSTRQDRAAIEQFVKREKRNMKKIVHRYTSNCT